MKYIFANWKMYLNVDESLKLAQDLANFELKNAEVKVGIFPNFLPFHQVKEILKGTQYSVGVQNASWVPQGAYTGAISAFLCKEAGAEYAIVGHSERRYIFGEKDEDVKKKVEACDDVGLIPVVCIGETREDMDVLRRQERLKIQIEAFANGRDFQKNPLIIAYEPVWAISSSQEHLPCAPQDAEDVIGWIKLELQKYTDIPVPVLYGGSVNGYNIMDYFTLPSVDGVLIGSASTKKELFFSILEQASNLV